ncbi:MAG: ATP-dependent DNA helicase, partial [Aedoeadaptatus pacaensis]
RLCPFEFALDLSNLSSVLIGDYNYVFHPKSYLERLMEDRDRLKRNCLLMDEAHNLIDRGRDMYSGSLSVQALESADYPSKKTEALARDLAEKIRELTAVENKTYDVLPDALTDAVED